MPVVHGVADGERGGDLLQFAGAVALTGGTVDAVLAQQQLDIGAAGLPDAGGIGADDHALLAGVVTGGDQPGDALDLDEAGAAGADLIDAL